MSEQEMRKTYVLNGNHYYQEELCFHQFKELIQTLGPVWDLIGSFIGIVFSEKPDKEALKGVKKPTPDEIIKFLGDDLPRAVAILLIPEGKTIEEQDIDQAMKDINVTKLSKTEEIIVDFLSLNDLPSHIVRAKRAVGAIGGGKGPSTRRSTGKKSSTRSARETSQKETSSGTASR